MGQSDDDSKFLENRILMQKWIINMTAWWSGVNFSFKFTSGTSYFLVAVHYLGGSL